MAPVLPAARMPRRCDASYNWGPPRLVLGQLRLSRVYGRGWLSARLHAPLDHVDRLAIDLDDLVKRVELPTQRRQLDRPRHHCAGQIQIGRIRPLALRLGPRRRRLVLAALAAEQVEIVSSVVPIEKTLIVGLGKPSIPKAAVLIRSRSAEPVAFTCSPLSPRCACSSACTRTSAASAACSVGLPFRACSTSVFNWGELNAVHHCCAVARWRKGSRPRTPKDRLSLNSRMLLARWAAGSRGRPWCSRSAAPRR